MANIPYQSEDPQISRHFPDNALGINARTRATLFGKSPEYHSTPPQQERIQILEYRPGVESPLRNLVYENRYQYHVSNDFMLRALADTDPGPSGSGPGSGSCSGSGSGSGGNSHDRIFDLSGLRLPLGLYDGDGWGHYPKQGPPKKQPSKEPPPPPPPPPSPTPSPSPEPGVVVLTEKDVAVFGDIRERLQNGVDEHGNTVRLRIRCTFCMDNVLGHDNHPPFAHAPQLGTPGVEAMQVLPCGHMVGYNCMMQWHMRLVTSHRVVTCPVCRYEVIHSQCRHNNRVYTIGPILPPLTIPEGGVNPPQCGVCTDALGRRPGMWS
ncbi:hypothetical protein F5Y11DRAFT_365569 [Daldinia sp. FL1419]|nr:hypothetical protein F5Y11DRAFT_365569 [Daldinia sp. FL1419]